MKTFAAAILITVSLVSAAFSQQGELRLQGDRRSGGKKGAKGAEE
jgi:hypothetical protein